jgi:hypothetical protein
MTAARTKKTNTTVKAGPAAQWRGGAGAGLGSGLDHHPRRRQRSDEGEGSASFWRS